MKKIGFIVDSACGLTADQARVRGWGYLPLIISVDNEEFQDGVDVDISKFYAEQLLAETDVRTSATPPGIITAVYDQMSKKYEHVLVFGLSAELSSQTSNLRNFAKGYKNIHVLSSTSVGNYIVEVIEHLIALSDQGKSFEEIALVGADASAQQYALIIPKTMKWFVKGGRITPAAAALAKFLQIVPVLALENGKIERYGKGRTYQKTIEKAMMDLDKKRSHNSSVAIYHGMNENISEILAMANHIFKTAVNLYTLPPVIAVHTGPEAIAIVITKRK